MIVRCGLAKSRAIVSYGHVDDAVAVTFRIVGDLFYISMVGESGFNSFVLEDPPYSG